MRWKGGRRWGDGVHVTEERTGRPTADRGDLREERSVCVYMTVGRRGGDDGEQSGKVIRC